MKKRIVLSIILTIAIISSSIVVFSGCAAFFPKGVSTFEELKNASDKGIKVKLNNDIDCDFETTTPLSFSEVKGNGFTIKNAVVTSNDSCASFFLTDKLTDVTFDGITVKGSGVRDAVAVATGNACKIENVIVKNCTIESTQKVYKGQNYTYIGAIYGGVTDKYNDDRSSDKNKCSIKNCSVENTTITLKEYDGEKDNYNGIYVGIVAGRCDNLSNSYAKDCKVTVSSSDVYCVPYVGGIVGESMGAIENCYAEDNELNVIAKYYYKGVWGYYSTSSAYCGGIVGRFEPLRYYDDGNTAEIDGGSISYCYADGNAINVKSTGDIYVGGIIGYSGKITVNQCYSKSNKIVMDSYISDNKNSVNRRCGGLIGSAKHTTISSCFVYNDEGMFEYTFPSSAQDSRVAGFVAGINGVIVTRCATFNADEKVNAPTKDEFCPVTLDNTSKCYVSATSYGNVCSCETLDENFWDSPNSIKSNLGLSSAYWKFDKGVPYLDLSE